MAATTQTDIMDRMAAVLEKLGENTKPYEPSFGDPAYQDRLRAEGHFDVFAMPVYQNGRECQTVGLSKQTQERAAGLRAGTYWGGKVTVEANGKYVHIKYKSQKVEDRMSHPWRSFEELVDRIWDEMHTA